MVGPEENGPSKLATSKPSRVFLTYWLLLLPVILGSLTYYLVGTIRDYYNTPYGTLVSTVTLTHFPTIEFCPDLWYDLRVGRNITDDNDALLGYILSFGFAPVPTNPVMDALDKYDRKNISQLRASYNKIVSEYENHTELLKALAFNPLDWITFYCSVCREEPDRAMEVIIRSGSVCFRLKRWKIDYSTIKKSDKIGMRFNINLDYIRDSLSSIALDDDDSGDFPELDEDAGRVSVAVGNTALLDFTEEVLVLMATDSYALFLQTMITSYLDKCTHKYSWAKRVEIIHDCVAEQGLKVCNVGRRCIYYVGAISDAISNKTLCHPYEHGSDDDDIDDYGECMDHMLDLCENEIMYPCDEATTSLIPQWIEKGKGSPQITVIPQNIRSILNVQEFQSFTWNSLISNVGGLFGLFLGASFYSLAKAIYCIACWFKCCFRRRH